MLSNFSRPEKVHCISIVFFLRVTKTSVYFIVIVIANAKRWYGGGRVRKKRDKNGMAV